MKTSNATSFALVLCVSLLGAACGGDGAGTTPDGATPDSAATGSDAPGTTADGVGPSTDGGATTDPDGGATTDQAPGVETGTGQPLQLVVTTSVGPAVPGSVVRYDAHISNVSARQLENVRLVFRVPPGLEFNRTGDAEPDPARCTDYRGATCVGGSESEFNLGALPAGSNRLVTIATQVVAGTADGSRLLAPFTLNATGVNTQVVTRTVDVLGKPPVLLTLGATDDSLAPGESFTLDLDLGQVAATEVTGASLKATLPPGLTVGAISNGGTQAGQQVTWSLGNLAVGATLRRTVTVTVDAGVVPASTLTTQAELTHEGGLPVDATAEHAVNVVAAAQALEVELTASASPVAPGRVVGYNLTVSNTAMRDLADIQVVMRLPPGAESMRTGDTEPDSPSCSAYRGATCIGTAELKWTIPALAPGASQTINMNATAVPETISGMLLTVPVTVSAAGVDPVGMASTVHVQSQPAMQLAFGSQRDSLTPGESFSLELDAGHIGMAPVAGAELRAFLPAGLTAGAISDGGTQPIPGQIVWPIGNVAVGGTLRRTIAVTVAATAPVGRLLKARAELSHDGGPALDGAAEHAVTVMPMPLPLKVDIMTMPNPVAPAGRVLILTTITNTSARQIDGIRMTMRVPTGAEVARVADTDPDARSCSRYRGATCTAESEMEWELDPLAAGMSRTVTVNAEVPATTTAGVVLPFPLRISAAGVGDTISVQTTARVGQ